MVVFFYVGLTITMADLRLCCMSATYCNADSRDSILETIAWSFKALSNFDQNLFSIQGRVFQKKCHTPKSFDFGYRPKPFESFIPKEYLSQAKVSFPMMTHGADLSRKSTTRIGGKKGVKE